MYVGVERVFCDYCLKQIIIQNKAHHHERKRDKKWKIIQADNGTAIVGWS